MWLQPNCFIGKTKAELIFDVLWSKMLTACALLLVRKREFSCYLEKRLFNLQLWAPHRFFVTHHLTQTGCMEFLSGFWSASISCTQHSRVQAPHKSHLGNKQLFLTWTLVWFNCGQFRSNLEQFEDARSHQQVVFQTANNLNPLQIPQGTIVMSIEVRN